VTERRHIVVVGAGLAGAATAYHLALSGVGDVLLLEREAVPGLHASGRNAALIREHADLPGWQPLTTEGAEAVRAGLAPFRRTGSLLLGLGDTRASEVLPGTRGTGRWCPDDGVVDVAALLATYLRGREVRTRTEVLSLARDGAGLSVRTSTGPLLADVVVNAAGAWAGAFGSVAVRPTNRHLFVSAPVPGLCPAGPFVWDVPHGLYYRPESGGLLLSACDETDAPPGETTDDPEVAVRLAHLVRRHQPALGDLRIAYRWVGQRTFGPGRLPVIGFDPEVPGLFHVAGLGGHGVTASYAIGRLAASLLA
jgi:D-arginine dehydrogenase